jgi:circadian clock protein KaiB
LKRICEKQIAGRYDLEVVDVYQQPERAAADKIIALPTLLRYSPGGAKRLIGDLSKEGIVCAELGLAS